MQSIYADGATHNDHHKELTINANLTHEDILNLSKTFFADDKDIEDVEFSEVSEDEKPCPHNRNQSEPTESEELCHFIYPGIDEEQGLAIHRQIKDLVGRFAMKDICNFLKGLAEEKKILLPQIPQNAFDELHRMGMPPAETKGFGYDNFCKYYRK